MEKDDESTTSPSETYPSFISGHLPKDKDIQYTIGPYQVLRSLGKGGMGEVLLAYDTKCGRRIALKKIRADLLEHKALHNRFLKEARITSQLTHPAIMPIYTIQDAENIVYYTMPFVRGETLKQILRATREQDKKGGPPHHIGSSIPALIRIFLTVCQAVAYAHSKGVLHRDLKPENIMIGQYGEILILDWGLAKLTHIKEKDEEDGRAPETSTLVPDLTRVGKVVGTVSYMAPERAKGGQATIQTEIYALGVTLYQLLSLHPPFRRGTLEEFLKTMDKEVLYDPAEIAPYRDVPRILSQIALKCLVTDPKERYQSVDEMIRELENYVEGRSEWFKIAALDIDHKKDWEFQENILMAEHIAITRGTDSSDWVSLMISKGSFTGNTKIECNVTIDTKGDGIGFLMSVPEAAERTHINDGYCLWLGSDRNRTTKLLRSTVEVIDSPDIFLERGKTYAVRIEKIDHNIHFYLNNTLQFSYISHLPLIGTHCGLLARDANFKMENLTVFVSSQNITVNCLAVPDAFLAHKDYATALNEYRRIGYSFPGRAEGREAMFRAGITILEEAKDTKDEELKLDLFHAALDEFERLHSTPGAPLEYLGKAQVYEAMNDSEEEMKCYEICLRKFPRHPLLPVLHEQLVYRMHETSRLNRKATYEFMLTALRHLPKSTANASTKKLFERLQHHWEPLHFIEEDPECSASEQFNDYPFRIQLAFWLAKPYAITEMIDELIRAQTFYPITLSNALFSLIELGAWNLAKEAIAQLPSEKTRCRQIELIQLALLCYETSPEACLEAFFSDRQPLLGKGEIRLLLHIFETAILQNRTNLIRNAAASLEPYQLPEKITLRIHYYLIWALLLDSQWDEAGKIFQKYPLSDLTEESSLLYILYGCWLVVTENREIAEIHFSGVIDTPYPPTHILLCHYLNGKISHENKWGKTAFLWEKRKLFQQLSLFYRCIGNRERETQFRELEQEQYIELG